MIFMEPGMDFQSKTAYLEDVQGWGFDLISWFHDFMPCRFVNTL